MQLASAAIRGSALPAWRADARLSAHKGLQAPTSSPISAKKQFAQILKRQTMYWTLELASYLEDAPWPATKEELIDYSVRTGAPLEVVENLQELEDDGQPYENIEEIWPDYPTKEDFFFNEDEY
jgi:hypothetical protein